MPELKPCPACGEAKSIVFIQEEFNNEWRGHCRCGHVGRYCATREAAITAWNSLPRRPDYNDVDCAGCPERRRCALTWTNEPPKVAGKYWWRPSGKKIGRIRDMFVRSGEVGFLDRNDRFIKDTGDGEWAGPIPAPID